MGDLGKHEKHGNLPVYSLEQSHLYESPTWEHVIMPYYTRVIAELGLSKGFPMLVYLDLWSVHPL